MINAKQNLIERIANYLSHTESEKIAFGIRFCFKKLPIAQIVAQKIRSDANVPKVFLV